MPRVSNPVRVKAKRSLACLQGVSNSGPVSRGCAEGQMVKPMGLVPSRHLVADRACKHPAWAWSLPSSLPGGGGVALTTAAWGEKLAVRLGTFSRVSRAKEKDLVSPCLPTKIIK